MSLIRTTQTFPAPTSTQRPILLLCGFGGRVWQLRRLIAVLNGAGHDVVALDFPKSVLSRGDAELLPRLTDEVVAFAESLADQSAQPPLLVGVSLGALLTLNILRRSPKFTEGVLITGGDIAAIARKLYPKVWSQSYDQLAAAWQTVNMYSDPAQLHGKRLVFVLHPSNKLIDTTLVRREIQAQQAAGNELRVVERARFDHVGTIVEETILFPRRTLDYIRQVSAA